MASTTFDPHASNDEHPAEPAQMNRTLIYVSLGLALLLVAGVLVGAKVVMQQLNNKPVALADVPSPMADAPECAELVGNLPERLGSYRRAEIADPAPAGAAVWRAAGTSAERVTLRCGVEAPLQYSVLTRTIDAGGATWIKITDPAPEAEQATWFTVDTSPVLAVTAPVHDDVVGSLDVSALPKVEPHPAPAPLSQVKDAPGAQARAVCAPLMDALPETLTDGYSRTDLGGVGSADGLDPEQAAAWGADGLDPIVLRCGVEDPPSYAAGAPLTQVNAIPWFEETSAPEAETSTVLYALGRATNIAVALPHTAGDGALNALSDLIARSVPEQ